MPWDSLTLAGDRLDGIDRTRFGYLRAVTIEAGEETDEARRFVAARSKVRVLLQGPKYCGPFAASFGIATFFDALADNADLAGDLAQTIAHAYAWFQYTHDSTSPDDIDERRAGRQMECLKEMLAAMSQSVPIVLGATDKPAGQPVAYAAATAMSTSGRTSIASNDGLV